MLAKIDAPTRSITVGLPGKIDLRHKPYEYYRDLLLSFFKPASPNDAAECSPDAAEYAEYAEKR
jgi:type I restriction enzyme S subunit